MEKFTEEELETIELEFNAKLSQVNVSIRDSHLDGYTQYLTTKKARYGRVVEKVGKLCILCFKRVPLSELNVLDSGHKEDVCKACAEEEKEILEGK